MKVQIRIPANMRDLADGASECEVNAASVREAINELLSTYPDIAPRLVDADGEVLPFVNLFLNGKHVRDLGGLDHKIATDSELMIVAALAGG